MRISLFALMYVLLLAGCGKDAAEPAPTFTSPDGTWTYTTPDKAITVEFELKTTDGALGIQNAMIKVNGTQGQAAALMVGADLPSIEQIRINANDAVLVVPYSITFDLCTVNGANNIISVSDASYTYPWGQLKTLSGVSITRK